MWLIQYLPDWIFYVIFAIGVLGFLVTFLLKFIPIPAIYIYKTPIQLVSVLLIAFGVYMSGAIANEQAWKDKVAKLEKEYAESQVKSEKVNTEVVTKYITKREVVRLRGEDQIRYIDREIVKYNEVCKLPKEIVTLHNDAAKAPK
jgi:uncharacterized membrane protein